MDTQLELPIVGFTLTAEQPHLAEECRTCGMGFAVTTEHECELCDSGIKPPYDGYPKHKKWYEENKHLFVR